MSTPVRERHIEMLYDMMIEAGNAVSRGEVGRYYDAILTELQEPSEGMLAAATSMDPLNVRRSMVRSDYCAIIQHIRDGGS